jgi:hypothetical protein
MLIILQLGLLCHVFANYHASHRGIYNRGGGFKDEPRPCAYHPCTQFGRYTPQCRAPRCYGCRMFRQHVDQVRWFTGTRDSHNRIANVVPVPSNVAAPTLCFTLVRVRPSYPRVSFTFHTLITTACCSQSCGLFLQERPLDPVSS